VTGSLDPRVQEALEVVRAGGLVAIPTETVYGLAADASNDRAVRRIFEVKGRPTNHPLIVHVASAEAAIRWAQRIPASATTLAEACWPGPLTVLLRAAAHVSPVVTGGLPTVGVRVPAHPLTLQLLEALDGGLAAPSANRFGRVSPTSAEHVLVDLGDDVDYVLDGGPSEVGVESTIVDCTVEPPVILRSGGIPDDEVARLLGSSPPGGARRGGVPASEPDPGPSRAPGMLPSHYAPRCAVVLATDPGAAAALAADLPGRVEVLDLTDDLVAYAQQLYARLRAADEAGIDTLVAVLPPADGLGYAIRDRLTKAAAPRPGDTATAVIPRDDRAG
jgi:L-threonylcarbamoyladenylate synthase